MLSKVTLHGFSREDLRGEGVRAGMHSSKGRYKGTDNCFTDIETALTIYI